MSQEAEDLGKTWQSFVAENALRARDGEQVALVKNSRDSSRTYFLLMSPQSDGISIPFTITG